MHSHFYGCLIWHFSSKKSQIKVKKIHERSLKFLSNDYFSSYAELLEITEVVLVHCNIVNNDYQHYSRVLYTFVPNKSFGSLLEISPTNHIFSKTFNLEYGEIIVWFTDQNSQPLEIKDRINLTMVIK